MSTAGGPGDKTQEFATQVRQKVREIRTQAMAKAPPLTGPMTQKAPTGGPGQARCRTSGCGADHVGVAGPAPPTTPAGQRSEGSAGPRAVPKVRLGGGRGHWPCWGCYFAVDAGERRTRDIASQVG
jgi:hypothetical protein